MYESKSHSSRIAASGSFRQFWIRQNRRKSEFKRLENRFFGCFFGFCDTIRSPITDPFRAVGRISNPHSDLRRVGSFGTRRKYRPFHVAMRPFCVTMRHFCVAMRHFCVTLRPFCVTSYHFANSDLRQIASRTLDRWRSCR